MPLSDKFKDELEKSIDLENENNKKEFAQYVHCKLCIQETGGAKGRSYTQLLEVGIFFEDNKTWVGVNCNRHNEKVARWEINTLNPKQSAFDNECDCCE
jgi:hypothetical protein